MDSSQAEAHAQDAEQCSTRLSCARTKSKEGALYDQHGIVGAVCIHGVPLEGAFCDLRGHENFVYYMVGTSVSTGRSVPYHHTHL